MTDAEHTTGPVQKLIAFSWGIVGILVLSLFMSILTEWVLLSLVWSEQGHTHAQKSYYTELSYLNDDLGDSLVNKFTTGTPRQYAEQLSRWIYEGYTAAHIDQVQQYFARQHDRAKKDPATSSVVKLSDIASEALLATLYVILLFGTRLVVLFYALPTFLLFAMLGIVDGLVMRDVRRWSAGRESSWVYHHAKRYLLVVLAIPFVVYLSLPWSVSPTWIVVPFAALEAIVLQTTLKMFKKNI